LKSNEGRRRCTRCRNDRERRADVADVEVPAPPEDLGASGALLWRDLHTRLVLDPDETRFLLEICRTADLLDLARSASDAASHEWAMADLRQQRIAFARLVATLPMPDEADGQLPTRWGGVRSVDKVA
jgi:hypothetical protein